MDKIRVSKEQYDLILRLIIRYGIKDGNNETSALKVYNEICDLFELTDENNRPIHDLEEK